MRYTVILLLICISQSLPVIVGLLTMSSLFVTLKSHNGIVPYLFTLPTISHSHLFSSMFRDGWFIIITSKFCNSNNGTLVYVSTFIFGCHWR
jgi:hypothetical protein